MRYLHHLLSAALLLAAHAQAATDDDSKTKPLDPCTIKSPNTGSFFDLRKINVQPPPTDGKKIKDAKQTSWHARGFDYGANFTVNICGPVIEELKEVNGIDKKDVGKVGAFYEKDGETYSLGMNNSFPTFRGRKLVLNYTDGSPCPSSSTKSPRARLPHTTENVNPLAISGPGDDKKKGSDSSVRRKSTIILLLCEREPTAALNTVSFIGSMDECTYFFEARSSAACPTINIQKETLGPGGVFGVIAGIAILVYIIGGVFYQRIVMHQRGWRQLPNYAIWAGIASFAKDMIVITGASCARCIPGQGRRGFGLGPGNGYSRAPLNGNGTLTRGGRSRGGSDDENRLIDQLDEEWDD